MIRACAKEDYAEVHVHIHAERGVVQHTDLSITLEVTKSFSVFYNEILFA